MYIGYYTQSKFDWLLVEVNLLYRRDVLRKNIDGSKGRLVGVVDIASIATKIKRTKRTSAYTCEGVVSHV